MKKLFIAFCTVALFTLGAGNVLAASDTTDHDITINVEEVALIDLNNNAAITFTIGAPALAGDAFVVDPEEDASKWLWYTSIVAGSEESRKITVEIDNSTNIPAGVLLYVEALNDADPTGGCGELGSFVAGPIELNDTAGDAEDIVTAIGSGYTGRVDGTDGVQLEYTLDIDGCEELFAGNYTVNVLYTLTDSE